MKAALFWVLLVTSFCFVALGQPLWIPGMGMFASSVGFALFWGAMLFFPERKKRFWLAVFWFAFVQAIQISWMTSIQYMGPLILLIYALLLFALGLQFGMLSLFLQPGQGLSLKRCLAASGCWVLFEWVRLFPFNGFPWNPVGLALADSSYAIQWASLFGVYGLSFWVIWVNLLALNAFFLNRTVSWRVCWAVCALLPFGFGLAQRTWVERFYPVKRSLSVALVQTALLPEQRDWTADRQEAFIHPLTQWERIFALFQEKKGAIDLIVLPEAALPFGAYRPIYPFQLVEQVWKIYFGDISSLPPLQRPFAASFGKDYWKVNNAYLAQALANHFQAHLIVGLDAMDGEKNYNAAFHFCPQGELPDRYEKRILMPVAEYLPFPKWELLSKFFSDQFGIGEPFHPGKEAKVFSAFLPIGISICAEETYSHLTRQVRLKGAEFLVNISNDVWFPRSHLPAHHFQHGRIRAVENGIYLFRSCNTGVTGVIDCFGKPLLLLEPSEKIPAALFASVPLRSFATPYLFWGDMPILALSFLFFLLFWRKKLL